MCCRSSIFVVAVIHATLAVAQPAAVNRSLNPAYLSEMPSVDRILREIKAGDPQETAARQMGAFIQLGRMIADMSGGRRDLTPDEQAIRRGYQAARGAIQSNLQDQNLARALRGYDTNRSFQEELFNRFFSPAFRAQYASTTAEMNARIQGSGNPQPTPRAPPVPAAPATRPAPTNPPAAARTPDPSIAKARAANVDTNVFGIPLGEPLTLPVCAHSSIFDSGSNPTNCILKTGLEELGAAVVGALVGADSAELSNLVTIQVTQNNCPTWMDCAVTGTLDNGLLVAVSLTTNGREVEAAVGKELRGKYGQRASMQQRFISPNNGSRDFEVWDLDWELPGLHVGYRVVNDVVTKGLVRIESERIYQLRRAQIREATKPKL
jgi:hypothetical protein